MMLRVCALYDTKAKAFMVPQYFATTAMAVRAVKVAVNDPQAGFLYRNPEDFILFHVADWEDQTGKFTPLQQPENLGLCAAFKLTPLTTALNQMGDTDEKNA